MKFRITMKDPDAVYDPLIAAARRSVEGMGLSAPESEAVSALRTQEWNDALRDWFRHGEYLTVEYDTEAKTLRIVPTSEKPQ